MGVFDGRALAPRDGGRQLCLPRTTHAYVFGTQRLGKSFFYAQSSSTHTNSAPRGCTHLFELRWSCFLRQKRRMRKIERKAQRPQAAHGCSQKAFRLVPPPSVKLPFRGVGGACTKLYGVDHDKIDQRQGKLRESRGCSGHRNKRPGCATPHAEHQNNDRKRCQVYVPR